MINGAHVIIYSKDAEADRSFFKNILGFHSVDAGHGWLIFALPPAEVACHPGEENDQHELYLMCDDVEVFVEEMKQRGVAHGLGQRATRVSHRLPSARKAAASGGGRGAMVHYYTRRVSADENQAFYYVAQGKGRYAPTLRAQGAWQETRWIGASSG